MAAFQGSDCRQVYGDAFRTRQRVCRRPHFRSVRKEWFHCNTAKDFWTPGQTGFFRNNPGKSRMVENIMSNIWWQLNYWVFLVKKISHGLHYLWTSLAVIGICFLATTILFCRCEVGKGLPGRLLLFIRVSLSNPYHHIIIIKDFIWLSVPSCSCSPSVQLVVYFLCL